MLVLLLTAVYLLIGAGLIQYCDERNEWELNTTDFILMSVLWLPLIIVLSLYGICSGISLWLR